MIIVFDMSGVFFNKGLKVAVKNISAELDLDPKDIEFVLNGSFAEKYRTGLVEPEEFWENAKEYLKVDDIDKVKQLFFEAYHPIEESVELVMSLKEKNIKLAFLSNSPKDRAEYLDKKYNFISLFDFGLFSFEAHSWKPNKEIYEKFLEKFNLDSKDVVYTDDKEVNLVPAKELGMKTILFNDAEDFKQKIKEFIL